MRISDWSSDVCASDLQRPAMEDRPASQEAARRSEGLAGSAAGGGAIGDHFAAEGRRARGHFLAACGAAGIPVRSFPMPDGAARGKGRLRSVDMARIGSPEADRVLAICPGAKLGRSEERRAGHEGVSTCRSQWTPNSSKKKNNN